MSLILALNHWETLNTIGILMVAPPARIVCHGMELPETLFISVPGNTIFSYFLIFSIFFFFGFFFQN